MLKENECLEKINTICNERNYTLLGYCDKNGNECEWYGCSTYLKLKCNKCGNIWNTCTYYNFTQLKGCPKCKQSHLEIQIENFLKLHNISFIAQKKFNWLGYQSLDFYIPSKNIAIECQGRQHFKGDDYFGKEESFKKTLERDCRKKELCDKNNVKLLYFSNLGIEYPYEVIEDENVLLQKILES